MNYEEPNSEYLTALCDQHCPGIHPDDISIDLTPSGYVAYTNDKKSKYFLNIEDSLKDLFKEL